MKPYFVKSSVESLSYLRGDIVTNNPVNLSAHLSVHKDRYRWHPDNTGLPSIVFKSCVKGNDTVWAYKDEKTRDQDYEKIVKNQFDELNSTEQND